ncbi:voltage-gated ion channel protein [Chloropicon roscoffensis]|uniref:Voltage-gated ion channel protein n=1 Tax=Chloropicon roscoffensis TaxID=1461544 RepID=A0AAX4P1X4_9CHLO
MTEDARPGASDHKPLEHKPSITLRSPGSPALYGLSRSRSPATFSNGSPRDATHATPVGALHKAVSLQSLMALSGVRSATPPYSPYSFTFSPPSRRQAYIEEAMSLASPTDPQLDTPKQSRASHMILVTGFEVSGGLGIFVFDSATDFLFLVDIVLNFRTVVEVAGMVLTKPKDIGKYYLRTWFGLDLVSSFPVDVVLLFAGAEPGDSETLRVNRMLKVLKCFRLLRVFRLARLSRIMHNARTLLSIKHSFRWIGKYSLCVLLAAHYISCGWFLVANVEEDGGEEHASWVTQFHMAGADEPGTLSNASLKTNLIQCLTLFSFNPNEIIVNEGEVGTEMFFIADGIVEVYLASKVLRRMKDGDYFGEIALMSELAIRTASVRAISFCDIFCLTKAAVDEVLSRYPEDKEKWKKICSRRIFVHSPSKKKSRTTYDRGVDPVSGGSDSKSWKSFLQSMSSFGRSSRSSSRRKFEKDFTSIVTAEAEARDKEEGSQGTPRSATGEPGVSEEMGAMEDAVLGREDSTGILKNLLAELQMEKELRMKKEEELRVVEAKISKFVGEVHRGAM